MEQSKFQFSNPHITKIDFRVNEKKIDSNDMPISIDVKSEVNKENKEAVTALTLVVGEVNEENEELVTSIYFNGTIAAEFKWAEEIKNPESMLKVSGGTVLLSYIRPILATLTMQAGLKPLNIPFVDFTK